MKKSPMAAEMNAIQAEVARFLIGVGFRRRARAFNRTTADGLVQVIEFLMGRFDPPGTIEIPGLRENLYGRFTVNLGVYVPEMHRREIGAKALTFIRDYHCNIQSRLGALGPERRDLWWIIECSNARLVELVNRLDRDALPFLDHFGNRDAIVADWPAHTRQFDGPNSHTFALYFVARILMGQGRREQARRVLEEGVREKTDPLDAVRLSNWADELGLGSIPS